MAATMLSAALIGVDAALVDVEADIAPGLPNFVIVGLPDATVKESRERIRAAFRSCGLPFPRQRLTVNLAPADVRKEGSSHDLPIAIAILAAQDIIPRLPSARRTLFLGELAFDGALRSVAGVLPSALSAAERGVYDVCVPIDNADEAALAPGVAIIPVADILQLVRHLRGEEVIPPHVRSTTPNATTNTSTTPDLPADFAAVKGQRAAKRALEIAAAGNHNVLLSGPPGAGKTMLARAMPGILPSMTASETLEVTKIHSVAGRTATGTPVAGRPFRSPHHTASSAALIGGGSWPRPGEVSLAHRGVLFLDEFPEFPRAALESLRQPLEDGFVTVSRASSTVRFPAACLLVAAMNPCPCGMSGVPNAECSCTPQQALAYAKRLSGPLLDRIDLHVHLPRTTVGDLFDMPDEESSSAIRERVERCRAAQHKRFTERHIATNAEMTSRDVRAYCRTDAAAERLLRAAADRLKLSARSCVRVLKVARTVADLAGSEHVDAVHVAEALHFRERSSEGVRSGPLTI